ncbi:MAG: polymerase, sigma-24 subunit, subfamily [Planctomycetaceae bacterium]|nr:polymerase, sigma-24 subunit, subfamily [Planctomycetaceae bacterium]
MIGPEVQLPEVQLVERCLAGDSSGARSFVEMFQGTIFGLCYRMVGHRQDAEDLTQEVFTRAFRSLSGWDRIRPLKPWLLMIAANCCRTALSKRARLPECNEFADDVAARPEIVRDTEFAEAVQRALATLREDHRACFILFYEQELSVNEVAETLGCPEGTIKTWLHRARKDVAELLKRQGFGADVPDSNRD